MNIPPKVHGEPWTPENGLHYTMIFHTFVFMQAFNEINCRKLGESEFNVFEGFFNNPLFLLILIITTIVQILLVQYGGEAIKCSPLTVQQHLICIVIGSISLLVSFIVKLLPLSLFSFVRVNEEPLATEEQRRLAYQHSLRKSRSIYRQSSLKNVGAAEKARKQRSVK